MMKKIAILKAYNVFDYILKKNEKNVKYNYLIAINKDKIKSIKEVITEINKPSKEQNEYQEKRIDLCKKYCDKDDNGNPITTKKDNKEIFSGLENNEEFKKEFEQLNEDNKGVIEEIENQSKQLSELLEEEESIEWKKINIDLFPNNTETEIIEFFIEIQLIEE